MKTTAKEAKEETIFVYENGKIQETTLYDHVMRSNSETTSPRGVEPIKFIEEVSDYWRDKKTKEDVDQLDDDIKQSEIEEYSIFFVYKWSFQKKIEVARFDNEYEADNYLFQWIYEGDFQIDDQRTTNYYSSIEEAEEDIAENIFCIDVDVYRSIERKRKIVEDLRAERKVNKNYKTNKKYNDLANVYAKGIINIPFETKQDTTKRISKELGRVDSNVFYRVVNIVRSNQNNIKTQ